MTKRLDLAARMRRRDAIWLSEERSTDERAVMNAIAMHEDADGLARPSMPRLGKCSGLSERACRGIVRRLQLAGVLHVTPGGGLHRPNTYRLLIESETRQELPPLESETRHELPRSTRQELPPSEVKPGTGRHQTRQLTSSNPAPGAAEPSLEPVNEPQRGSASGSSIETKTKSTKRGGRAPRTLMREGWKPTAKDREAVVAAGLDADAVTSDFVNFWLADGRLMANWDAAFRQNLSRILRTDWLRVKLAAPEPIAPPPKQQREEQHGPPMPPPPGMLERMRRFARGEVASLSEEPGEEPKAEGGAS